MRRKDMEIEEESYKNYDVLIRLHVNFTNNMFPGRTDCGREFRTNFNPSLFRNDTEHFLEEEIE